MTLAERTRRRQGTMGGWGRSFAYGKEGGSRSASSAAIKFGPPGHTESYRKAGDPRNVVIAGKLRSTSQEHNSAVRAGMALIAGTFGGRGLKRSVSGGSTVRGRQLPAGGGRRPEAPQRDTVIYAAADALRAASLAPAPGSAGRAASLLHRAAHDEVDRRPRHAAIALAAWEALTCTPDPLGAQARRRVLWEMSRMLLSKYVSTDSEMEVLDRIDAVGLERIPPFEQGLVGRVFDAANAEPLR